MFRESLINLVIFIVFISAYLYLRNKNKPDENFKHYYYEVLNSDKYKVKRRFEE
jgi:hypothetical protein